MVNDRYAAPYARLNRPTGYAGSSTFGAWMPATLDVNQFIGVHLGGVKMVSGIVLQGMEDADNWVTKFKVAYKNFATNVSWVMVKDANQQQDVVCLLQISSPLF